MSAAPQDRHQVILHKLIGLLADERKAIAARDSHRVAALATAKSAALGDLAGLLSELRKGKMAEKDRAALATLIDECQAASRNNAVAINGALAQAESRLRPLMNASPTYGPRRGGASAYTQGYHQRVSTRV